MANIDLKRFQKTASKFLQDEIDKQEDAKISIGGINFSAKTIAKDAVSSLINKGPKGLSKSINTHLVELGNQTTSIFDTLKGAVNTDLKKILSGFNLPSTNKLSNSVQSSFLQILSGVSNNPSIVYNMAKNGSKEASKNAKERISIASQIIKIIANIRAVRSTLQVPTFSKSPLEAASAVASNLSSAKSFLVIVQSGFEASRDPKLEAKVIRREASYNKALELMSDALDELKIGTAQFKLPEYMKLRLDFKVLISKFSKLDSDIQTTISNVIKAEEDFEVEKTKIGAIEGAYVREVFNRLSVLIQNVEATVEKGNDALALNTFADWTNTLLAIYTLAHNAFDKDVEAATTVVTGADKLSYSSISTSYQTLQPQVNAEDLVGDMTFLAELYFNVLRSTTFTEAFVKEKEDEITSKLSTLAQLDQQIISENNSFNPTLTDILGVLLSVTGGSGLDKIADSIKLGSVSGLFGLLTERLGSSAAEAAGSLGDGLLSGVDTEVRETLLRANARIQGIQRKRQIAGTIREKLADDAEKALDKDLLSNNKLKAEIEGLNL
jgi:hypothetical protein